MRELLALREQFGTAIMLVTHDMGVAARMADRLLVLKDGRMVEIGSAADVLRRPTTPEHSLQQHLDYGRAQNDPHFVGARPH